mgnify:CR=1 FL=1
MVHVLIYALSLISIFVLVGIKLSYVLYLDYYSFDIVQVIHDKILDQTGKQE